MKKMSHAALKLRRLAPDDWPEVRPLVRQFYAHFGYAYSAAVQGRVFRRLLGDPRLGFAWLLEEEGVAVGYLVLTLGWSIEYGGRVAMVDEIFVTASRRGHGVGRAALRHARREARRFGIRRLFLEVEGFNARAKRLYRKSGYLDTRRTLMTLAVL
jgi:GNAT superfamily N-acetyltransferase